MDRDFLAALQTMPIKRTIAFILLAFFLASSVARAENPMAKVKVGILYENVTDGPALKRSYEDTQAIVRDTHADFVFRGFWKLAPVAESPDRVPSSVSNLAREEGRDAGKSGKDYQSLKTWIERLKWQNPRLIFCGALSAAHLPRVEIDALTGKVFMGDETWGLALDPQKWAIVFNGKIPPKEKFQAGLSKNDADDYDRRNATAYFPDLTNPDFQFLFESWAKKQIDMGADALWIDGLFFQTKLFLDKTKDIRHPAVVETYKAVAKIVGDLRKYARDKGKSVIIGAPGQDDAEMAKLSPPLDLDFVTVSPSRADVEARQLDVQKWLYKLATINKVHNNVSIFAYIDWESSESSLAVFSQKLGADDRKNMLRSFDKTFAQMGVNFIYPVRGGFMGERPKKRSFGNSSTFDSLAPQFDTFETIKILAEEKALVH